MMVRATLSLERGDIVHQLKTELTTGALLHAGSPLKVVPNPQAIHL